MRKTLVRSTTLLLANISERAFRKTRKGGIWERVRGGPRFVELFPELGETFTVGEKGVSITNPREMLAIEVLQSWGYL